VLSEQVEQLVKLTIGVHHPLIEIKTNGLFISHTHKEIVPTLVHFLTAVGR